MSVELEQDILFSIFSIFSTESQLESNTQNPQQISTNKRKRQDDTDDVTSDSRAKRRKDSDDVIIMEFQEQSSKQKSETDADVIVVEETGAAIEQGANKVLVSDQLALQDRVTSSYFIPEIVAAPNVDLKRDLLWTDKYAPRCVADVLGKAANIKRLFLWLEKWKKV